MSRRQGSRPSSGPVRVAAVAAGLATITAALLIGRATVDDADSAETGAADVFVAVETGRLSASVVTRGDVVARDPLRIEAPTVEGLAVITQIPSVGDSISSGSVIYEINDRPVISLAGQIPLYRDLGIGDRGDDVVRLQQALIDLGLLTLKPSGSYDRGTAAAVERLYREQGHTAPPAPPSVLAEVQAAEAYADELRSTPEPDAATLEALSNAEQRMATARAKVGAPALSRELLMIGTLPATVLSVGREIGSDVAGEDPVMTLSSGGVAVELPFLDPGFERFVGRTVDIYATPDAPVEGIVDGYRARTEDAQVLVVRSDALPESEVGRNLRVVIRDQEGEVDGLLIPISALVSRRDGSGEVHKKAGTSLVVVRVTVLGEADGTVAVQPVAGTGDLAPGDLVRVATS